MEVFLQFMSQIVPWVMSAGSLYLAFCVLNSNERQKKFEVYFEKKTAAYNFFLEQMALVYLNPQAPITGVSVAYYQAVVFSNQAAKDAMNKVVNCFTNSSHHSNRAPQFSFNAAFEELILAIRSDLDECQSELLSAKRCKKHKQR